MNATASAAISSTDAQPPDNSALIGGVVGGIVALLLIGGLIAFLVARSRAGKDALQSARDAGAASHRTNYDSLTLSTPENNYGEVTLGPPQNYAAWTNKDENYASPSQTMYEHGNVTKFR